MGTTEEILTELLGVEMELQDVQGIFSLDFNFNVFLLVSLIISPDILFLVFGSLRHFSICLAFIYLFLHG